MDTNYIKSTPGLLLLLDIVASAVAIGCYVGSDYSYFGKSDEGKYVLAAICITLILCVVFYVVLILGKLSDERIFLGMLFLCAILIIIAVVLVAVRTKFFSAGNFAMVAIIVLAILLVVQILLKLGLIKG